MVAWCHIGLQKAYTQNDRESSVLDSRHLQATFLEKSAFYNFFSISSSFFLSNVPGLWLLWCGRSLMMPNSFDVVSPISESSVQSLTWKQTVSQAKVPDPNTHTHCKLWPLRSGCCKLFWTEYSCSHICQLIISLIVATSDNTSRKLGFQNSELLISIHHWCPICILIRVHPIIHTFRLWRLGNPIYLNLWLKGLYIKLFLIITLFKRHYESIFPQNNILWI